MKIFTDCPDRIPADRVVSDPSLAQVVILFSPASAGVVAGVGKPTYLVAGRMPLSLVNAGAGVRLVHPAELDRLLVGEAGGGPPQVQARADGRPERVRDVIVSYSPGTNVGKTFIASNMAAWLARHGRPAVLLDLDIEGSGTWELLGLKGSSDDAATIAGWNGDPEAIRQAVAKGEHPKIGQMYMIKRGPASGAAQVVRAVETLAGLGFTVVVDTSNNQELPYINSVLRIAAKVFLVATLTLKLQTRLAEMYATARSAKGLAGKMVLCVNRVGYHEEETRLYPEDLARQFMLGKHYVVHESAKGRRAALRKKTLPVAMNSSLGRELAVMFEGEFPDSRPERVAVKGKAGFFGLGRVTSWT